ncbi:MAG: AraC family transcriptional regulator [Alphaproteobacteria bacterium HGW-Alphaproteobacteria-2]|nr:MAG: AraC family transcriptional regulator [Alphaproteobacteria bacterium HGW-Alphaproteobacteria-2]
MPENGYIVATTLRGPLEAFRRMGGDAETLVRHHGLAAGARDAPPTVALHRFVGVFQSAAAGVCDSTFGWRAGQAFDLSDLGEMGTALETAPTLGAALATFCRAFAAVQSDSVLRLHVSGGRAHLCYRILDPNLWPRDQDAEFTMSILSRLIARAAGPGWRPIALEFEHGAHAGLADESAALHCRIGTGAEWNELIFHERVLDLPMPGRDVAVFRPLLDAIVGAARAREAGLTISRRVRQILLADLGHGGVTEARIAAQLGRSERTLRRQLRAEGAVFSELLAQCRIDLARHWLSEGTLDAPDIALRLGYSDPSAFRRAFRRRTGQTPASLRAATHRA